MLNYKEARLRYKPSTVKTLFIGESPPAKGDYFYFGGGNILLEYIRQAFVSVYGDKCGNGDDFLQFFKEKGYYLIDLSEEPINGKLEKERRQLRRDNVGSLAKRVAKLNPESVIIIMKAIEREVRAALPSNIHEKNIRVTRFPGFGNQMISIQQISCALHELRNV